MPVPASLTFMAQLTDRVDGDITLLLRGPRAEAVGRAVLDIAGRPPHRRMGEAARRLEDRERTPAVFVGAAYPRVVGRAGAVTILASDDGDVLLRWSHVAGDGWSLQQLVLAACEQVGAVPDGTWCDCAGWLAPDRRDGPTSLAEAAREMRRAGGFRRSLWTATRAAVGPVLGGAAPARPAARPDGDPGGGSDAGTDVVVLAELPDLPELPQPPEPSSGTGRVSTFSRRSVQVLDWLGRAGLLAPGRNGLTVGVAVNLRLHEPSLADAPAGNLSGVGFLHARYEDGATDLAAFDAELRHLVRRRFWRYLAQFDRLFSTLPESVVRRVTRALLDAPPPSTISVTEGWSDSSRPCPGCGAPGRPTPDDLDVVLVPSAIAGGGAIAGLSRRRGSTVVAVRLTGITWRDVEAALRQAETWQEPSPKVVGAGPTILATERREAAHAGT
jgi:hypothetical protein